MSRRKRGYEEREIEPEVETDGDLDEVLRWKWVVVLMRILKKQFSQKQISCFTEMNGFLQRNTDDDVLNIHAVLFHIIKISRLLSLFYILTKRVPLKKAVQDLI